MVQGRIGASQTMLKFELICSSPSCAICLGASSADLAFMLMPQRCILGTNWLGKSLARSKQ